jgi:hypothetical protein
MPYIGGFPQYTGVCDSVAAEGYRGFARHAASEPDRGASTAAV